MKKFFLAVFSFLFCLCAFSQEAGTILTAGDYFKKVSSTYAQISQYESDVEIIAGKNAMKGHISFKRPSMLRIDFSNPDKQTILYNGSELIIYLPKSSAILRQEVATEKDSGATNVATPQGLSLMSRYYSVQYENGPSVEPYNPNDPRSELVYKLVLTRKNNSESFRTMKIAISPDTNLIKSIRAFTTNDEEFSFTFSNYELNQEIPDTRFLYDQPPTANEYNNFLFTE